MAITSLVGEGIVGSLFTNTSYFHYVNSHLNPANARIMQAIAPVLGSASALATYNIMSRTTQ